VICNFELMSNYNNSDVGKMKMRKKNPVPLFDSIISKLKKFHQQSVDAAQNFGYALLVFENLKSIWENMSESKINNNDAAQMYKDNIEFLQMFNNELDYSAEVTNRDLVLSGYASGSSAYFVNSTSSTDAFMDIDLGLITPYESLMRRSPERQKEYSERFSKIDTNLGKTFKEIWEALYGTKQDPERAALFLIRQAFDHLFNELAPDKEVRNSIYWERKKEGKQNQIYRRERIEYAANKFIKDKYRRNTVLATSKNMLNVYDSLNRAHNRGELDKNKARNVLHQMATFLENWIDAITIDK